MQSGTSPFDLSDMRIALTGAAGGIGTATARLCTRLGAEIVACDLEAPTALADELAALGRSGGAHAVDVRDRAAVEAFAGAAGAVDALIDCAAICPPGDWQDPGWDWEFDRVMSINLKGPVNLARAFMPGMAARGGGRIALIGSVAGRLGGLRSGAHYAMSKGGIHAFVRWLAKRGAADGVLVNAVAPAPVDTAMIVPLGLDPADLPLKRFARPEEIAAPLAFLCSPAASYISGAVLDINGAMHFS
jgi:NAD(P)-dependent dehydrogenase (short-subunit alcohol dehydrogenase family)